MNIQIFHDGNEDTPLSIDMEKVEAITEVNACVAQTSQERCEQGSFLPKKLSEYPMKDINENTVFVIDGMLQTSSNSYRAQLGFTADELWDEIGLANEKKYTKAQKAYSLAENFTDEEAMRLMVRYWKNMADTPLTKNIIGENHFRVPKNKETHEPKEEEMADPNVCKKLRVGLYTGDGKLVVDEIVYPGFMEDLTFEEFDMLGQKIDFATVDDPDHPNMIVTDDIAFLAERMCQEWGESYGQHGETYVAKVLDSMVSGIITADRIHIDGNIFNAADGQYIVAERYKKDIEYTDRTKEFMKQIGKELKK